MSSSGSATCNLNKRTNKNVGFALQVDYLRTAKLETLEASIGRVQVSDPAGNALHNAKNRLLIKLKCALVLLQYEHDGWSS